MAVSKRARSYVLFNTDCEGPTVANDHAFEVAAQWAGPDGARLYRQLSRFDDITAYVLKRPFYNTGDTLRLVLPFLKGVGGLTDERLLTTPPNVQWIAGARDAIGLLLQTPGVEVFEISASYYPFASHVAELLGIRKDRVYSTYFSLDAYEMGPNESERLKDLAAEIVMLDDVPPVDLEQEMDSLDKFPPEQHAVLKRMKEIIWGELAEELPCSAKMLREIRSMGGYEKFNAIRDSLWRMQREQDAVTAEDVVYVGDSITDREAFLAVTEMGGVSIAFNGNSYAVDAAEFCAWGDTSLINALAVGVFRDHGKDGLREFIASRDPKLVPSGITSLYESIVRTQWGIAERASSDRNELVRLSDEFRKSTRAAAASLS